ncbi:MAG: aromatic ring-hydroxylating dioxygenase subunit alpha, partial [Candidatus Paceibacterales bacterium]
KEVTITVTTSNGQVLVNYDQPNDKIGFTSLILNPKNKPMVHTDLFIMPNITRVDYTFGENGYIIISQCSPVSTLKTRVYTAIIYRVGFLTTILKPFMKFYTRRVIQQDVDIMLNQGENFKVDMSTDFHGTDADVVHSAIERLRVFGVRGDNQSLSFSEKLERKIWI